MREHQQWFSELAHRQDCRYFAIESGKSLRHVGNVWLWAIDASNRKAELRIVIGEKDCVEQGIGTAAIKLLCRYAFNIMKLHKVYSYVHVTNRRARRAFEKAGFAVDGLLRDDRCIRGRFVSVHMLSRISHA
ncbi:hypothetical protein W02_13640 [Nitrospira sp. KM1]|nr:hypothetical protein W02_13640 [Nitrospira sp. KM1]